MASGDSHKKVGNENKKMDNSKKQESGSEENFNQEKVNVDLDLDNDGSNVANPASQRQIDLIKETASAVVGEGKKRIYCLNIIGEIEGQIRVDEGVKATRYEQVLPLLVSVEESDDIKGLLIILNTVGGDVEAGLAIAELISGMKKPTVSFVIGAGHSIGVPLAVSAKKSYIAKSANMLLHPVNTSGKCVGVYQQFLDLKRIQKRITNFVADNSKVSRKDYLELCLNKENLPGEIGTVLSGKKAVQIGLIDEIGGLSSALKTLHSMIN